MEFHIARDVRTKYGVDDLLFSYTGNVVFANVAASRKLAQAMNEARGSEADPAPAVNAGALFAMGLIDELNHALVAQLSREIDPAVLAKRSAGCSAQAEPAEVDQPAAGVHGTVPEFRVCRGKLTPPNGCAAQRKSLPNREAALEELLLLWLATAIPDFAPFRELFDDSALKQSTVYET